MVGVRGLSDDAGDIAIGTWWTDRALELAQASGSPDTIAYVLARKSQQTWTRYRPEHRGGAHVVGLAQASTRETSVSAPVRAFGYVLTAHGHSLSRDATGCQRALAAAEELAMLPSDDQSASEGSRLGGFCTPVYLRVQEANCWLTLGRPDQAVESFTSALAAWPAQQERERGVHLAQLAAAYAGAGEREQAIAIGLQAAEVASATYSIRIATELQELLKGLGSDTGAGRADLDEAIRSLIDEMGA